MSRDVRNTDINEGTTHVRLVLGKSEQFTDVRCPNCGALLYREILKSESALRTIEIKCRRCGTVNLL